MEMMSQKKKKKKKKKKNLQMEIWLYISTRDSHFRSIIPSFARKSSSKQEGFFALKGKNTIGEHTTLWKKKN